MNLDMSIEAQGARMRNYFLEEQEKRNSRKTIMLTSLPTKEELEHTIKIKFIKEKNSKTKEGKIFIEPLKKEKNREKILKILKIVEDKFIEPILKEKMILFRMVINGIKENKNISRNEKSLKIFSKLLKIDLTELYNIKGVQLNDTKNKQVKEIAGILKKLYDEKFISPEESPEEQLFQEIDSDYDSKELFGETDEIEEKEIEFYE